ncbi:hypothetical protein, partial [uncultured Bradyrhizobium sp.]|uniref:hypothetical protein n=1 Tax=uncultured Bradyrhizobium sp. TaxID=199684 RepID=UPI0026179254
LAYFYTATVAGFCSAVDSLRVAAFLSSYSLFSNVTHRKLLRDLTVRSADSTTLTHVPMSCTT